MYKGVFSILSMAASVVAMGVMIQGAASQSTDKFRIGVINDQFGTYADFSGVSTVEAVKMAAEDAGGTVLGKPIEILSADHQNDKAKGVAIVTDWFDKQNVSAVADINNSGVALAVQ